MITTILNGYRRPQNLKLQVEAIKSQFLNSETWLWINHHEDWNLSDETIMSYGVDKIVRANHNFKYLGRFSLAMLAQTSFVCLFDDDTIPGNNWYKNCLETFDKTNGIIGGVGLIQHDKTNYMNHTRYGWPSHNEQIVKVDLVGHSWFVNKRHLAYLWLEEPATYETAEDMHLSYTAQKYGDVNTYVPPHPINDQSMHSSLFGYQLGVDHTTPSVNNQQSFFSSRDYCLKEYVKRGWRLCSL